MPGWTYSYNPSVNADVFKLRRLIRDVNLELTGLSDRRSETCFFCDEELEAFLEDAGGDHYLAASRALLSLLADSRAMLTSLKIGTYGENYKVAIQELADKYEAMSEEYQPRTEVVETYLTRDSVGEYLDRGTDGVIDETK